MELLDNTITVLLVIVIRARVTVIHTVAHGVVEQDSNLTSSGGDSLRVTNSASKAAVKCAESSIAAPYGHGSKPKRYGDTATGFPGMRRQYLSAADLAPWGKC